MQNSNVSSVTIFYQDHPFNLDLPIEIVCLGWNAVIFTNYINCNL